MLAGFIVFAVFAILTGLASKLIPRTIEPSRGESQDLTAWRRAAGGTAVGCVLLAGLFVFLSSFHIVQAGHAGLVRQLGAVTGRHVGPGVNFTLPFVQDLVIYDTRVQKVPFENLEAASAEYQLVGVKGTLNYRINPAAVPWLFENVGTQDQLEAKVLIPALQQNLKAIMPRYPILSILPQRDQIATQVTAAMDATFANYTTDAGVPVVYFAPQELVGEGEQCVTARPADDPDTAENEAATAVLCPATVYLENVDFSDQFDKALEDKQVAQTKIDTERNVLAQVELQKEQRITQAEGEAEANKLIAESLRAEGGLEALQLKAIEKLGPDVRVIILPSDSNLIPLLGEQLLTGGP